MMPPWPGHDSDCNDPLYVPPTDAVLCTYNLELVAEQMDSEKSQGRFASGQ